MSGMRPGMLAGAMVLQPMPGCGQDAPGISGVTTKTGRMSGRNVTLKRLHGAEGAYDFTLEGKARRVAGEWAYL
jgi:hypothetical protein